jgi:hypothetical protein
LNDCIVILHYPRNGSRFSVPRCDNKNPRIFIRGKARGLCRKKLENSAGCVNPTFQTFLQPYEYCRERSLIAGPLVVNLILSLRRLEASLPPQRGRLDFPAADLLHKLRKQPHIRM